MIQFYSGKILAIYRFPGEQAIQALDLSSARITYGKPLAGVSDLLHLPCTWPRDHPNVAWSVNLFDAHGAFRLRFSGSLHVYPLPNPPKKRQRQQRFARPVFALEQDAYGA